METAATTPEHELFCPDCGYNLRGTPADRCSECGLGLAFINSPESGIPWANRRTRGCFRSFWATVWMVLFHTRVLAREVYRPVAMRDAHRFHAIALGLMVAGLFGSAAILLASPADSSPTILLSWLKSATPDASWYGFLIAEYGRASVWAWMFAISVGFLSAVLTCAGGTAYLFQPRRLAVEQQRRAIAMSCYAAAPMAVAGPLLVASVAISTFLGPAGYGDQWAERAAAAVIGLGTAWVWLLLVHLARRTLRATAAVLWVGLITPVIWAVGGGLTFCIFSVAAFYVAIIVNSLV